MPQLVVPTLCKWMLATTLVQLLSTSLYLIVCGEIENWSSQWKKVGWTRKGFEEESGFHWLSFSEE